MRGTPRSGVAGQGGTRFIPAHAGNAQPGRAAVQRFPVHPRACGERGIGVRLTSLIRGSSPRMRGTRGELLVDRPEFRFIPAHAGNASTPKGRRCSSAVHPRACGERLMVGISRLFAFGSSPRMRGTPRRRCCRSASERFIPAHAGNAMIQDRCQQQSAVHPRACGERTV